MTVFAYSAEEEVNSYSNRAEEALLDDVLDQSVETEELDDSYVIEDAEEALGYYGNDDELDGVFDGFGDVADDDNLE